MTAHTDLDAREALAERLIDDTTRSLEMLGVYLGLELGLYQALTDLGAATEAELAAHAGVAPRYTREWLEQQATAGYLTCDDPAQPAEERRYRLPAVPDLDRRLRSAPPARVLDLGCGLGASSVALARTYPRTQVLGVDLDQASIAEARAQAAQAGLADRVTFVVGDAAQVDPRPGSSSSPSSRRSTTWATRWGRCGRPAGCWPPTVISWSPTNAWLRPSPRPATRPSGSCTAGASCIVGPPPSPNTRSRPPARSCAPHRRPLGRRGRLHRVRGPTHRQPLLALLPPAPLRPPPRERSRNHVGARFTRSTAG
jgi:hypothetical protein